MYVDIPYLLKGRTHESTYDECYDTHQKQLRRGGALYQRPDDSGRSQWHFRGPSNG